MKYIVPEKIGFGVRLPGDKTPLPESYPDTVFDSLEEAVQESKKRWLPGYSSPRIPVRVNIDTPKGITAYRVDEAGAVWGSLIYEIDAPDASTSLAMYNAWWKEVERQKEEAMPHVVNREPLVIEGNARLRAEEEWWDIEFQPSENAESTADGGWAYSWPGLSEAVIEHIIGRELERLEWIDYLPLGRVRVTVELLDDNGGVK
jgi:hypothetical protein